jgi:hypothetical protein
MCRRDTINIVFYDVFFIVIAMTKTKGSPPGDIE